MASEYKTGNNYCVVGQASQSRTWVKRQDEAIDHAIGLMRDNSTTELLIVKVVARVRKAAPPIEVIKVK